MTVKAVEFGGVGTIPHILVEEDGVYKQIPLKTGITQIADVEIEKE